MILERARIGHKRYLYIGALSTACVEEQGFTHLGTDGYFLFETSDHTEDRGIMILGKIADDDAAYRLMEIWQSQTIMPHERHSADQSEQLKICR